MANIAKNTKSTVIPCFRYQDAPAAIEWLCRAFGFEKQAVHTNPDGTVAHAQLTFGGGMVMISSVGGESAFNKLMRQPNELGGVETQSPYIVVSDCGAVYKTAQEAGAVMELDMKDKDYGGQGFTCRDPEGHLWSIGNYDPWADGDKA